MKGGDRKKFAAENGNYVFREPSSFIWNDANWGFSAINLFILKLSVFKLSSKVIYLLETMTTGAFLPFNYLF